MHDASLAGVLTLDGRNTGPAIGTGAIFEVVYEIAKLIKKDMARESMPMTVFSGVLTGMLLLWVTGLLIK